MTMRPFSLASGQGESYYITTARLTAKITARDTGGAYSLLELTAPMGMAIAPHTHTREDETFIVLSGSFRLFCGTEVFEMEQGDLTFLPRGIPHWFEVTSPDFRALEVVSPGGFENMLEDMGELARAPRPLSEMTPEDMLRVLDVTSRHGHVITPPPGAGQPIGAAGAPAVSLQQGH
jgi:mannose-6-phosphate isomerase-like protein (cupin superfamily)